MRTSVQLWSLREEIRDSGFASVVDSVARIGYRAIEPFDLVTTGAALAEAVESNGLAVPTAHADLGAAALPETIEAATRLGVHTLVQPMFPTEAWPDRAALEATASILNDAAEACAQAGIRVAVHNHDDELRTRIDGRPALLELCTLLDDGVGVELDLYWSSIAGLDPVDVLAELGDRVVALHIKDGPIGGPNEAQQALGCGQLDLDRALVAAPLNALAVLSLDRYSGDAMAAVAESHSWLTERGHR